MHREKNGEAYSDCMDIISASAWILSCISTNIHVFQVGGVTTQMQSDANTIYQYLEKFDREKKINVYGKIWTHSIPSHT